VRAENEGTMVKQALGPTNVNRFRDSPVAGVRSGDGN